MTDSQTTLGELVGEYRRLVATIRAHKAEIPEILNATAAISNTSRIPSGHGDPGDPTGAAALRVGELETKIKEKTQEAHQLQLRIIDEIHTATPDSCWAILTRRFIHGESYRTISAHTNYAEGYCRKIVCKYKDLPVS